MAEAAISNRTAVWRAQDAAHHLHPFINHGELAAKGVRVITHADGVHIFDSEGNKLIDGMAGLWCVQVGYGREELAEAAARATREIGYYNTFFQTTTPQATELTARLAELAPQGVDRFFFANSGSEANDGAVKLIRYYWNLQERPEKKLIISRRLAYHGVTLAAASLSGLTPMHPQFDLPLDFVRHVEPPYWYGSDQSMSADDFGLWAAGELERAILEVGPERVAAFIGEPVMGAGGMITPPPTYWPEVQRICRKHDVLLWSDEVICGFGRTGRWFGCETYGFEPDIMTMAKGLSSGYQPISAIGLGERMGEAIWNADEELVHGGTYAGHPVAAAVALANLEIIEREGLVERMGRDVGPYFQDRVASLRDHPLVGETRGIGGLAGIELVKDKAGPVRFAPEGKLAIAAREHAARAGLIIRAVRDVMVLSPPLTMSRQDIDAMVAITRAALDATAEDVAEGRLALEA